MKRARVNLEKYVKRETSLRPSLQTRIYYKNIEFNTLILWIRKPSLQIK